MSSKGKSVIAPPFLRPVGLPGKTVAHAQWSGFWFTEEFLFSRVYYTVWLSFGPLPFFIHIGVMRDDL